MTREPLAAIDTTLAATTARLLGAAACSLGALGLLCLALAAAALLWHAPANGTARGLLWVVLAAAPLERVLVLRLRLDAGLFADLAQPASADPLLALDGALQALRLRAPAAAPRALADRATGACRLLFWHGSCVALQFGSLVLALLGLSAEAR